MRRYRQFNIEISILINIEKSSTNPYTNRNPKITGLNGARRVDLRSDDLNFR